MLVNALTGKSCAMCQFHVQWSAIRQMWRLLIEHNNGTWSEVACWKDE